MTFLENICSNKPNLYLVGFMGTGKSTVGRRVAEKLGFRFIDVDKAIEKEEGLSITELFAQRGEEAFRKLERNFIESGHPDSNCIVSCGGGLSVPEGMPELLKEKGIVVCLWATPEVIYERTKGNSTRPLLNVADPLSSIRKLLEQREPSYRATGILVSTVDRGIAAVSEAVVRIYQVQS
ncbi:MAG: shikimate kinase [Opitutae bacterium]|nr:shikimate kinase [Opitutae bacterium]|tara:strand:- start:534 stop:1073 length:540 start_codon:yes stop_codon:yes gene_type:complete